MKCQGCGYEVIENDVRFCPNCGQELKVLTYGAAAAQNVNTEREESPEPVPVAQPTKATKVPKPTVLLAGILGGAALIAVIAVGVLQVQRTRGEKESAATTATLVTEQEELPAAESGTKIGQAAQESTQESTFVEVPDEGISSAAIDAPAAATEPLTEPDYQPLAEQGSLTGVEDTVATIDAICALTDSGEYGGVGANTTRLVTDSTGQIRHELLKTMRDSDWPEVGELMNAYGYHDAVLSFYYDNPDYGAAPLSDGPIKIVAEIDGRSYTYYFFGNELIRRVAPEATTDNIKTNDFLRELYRIGFTSRWEFNEEMR